MTTPLPSLDDLKIAYYQEKTGLVGMSLADLEYAFFLAPPAGGGGGGDVSSVAGRTGDVVLTKADVGLTAVDNTSDASKPVSGATQTALDLKANLASPTFTGSVTVPAPSAGGNPTTKTYVDAAVAPKANLASPTFTGVVTVPTPTNATDASTKGYVDTADALKAPLASPTFTGTVTVPTPAAAGAATTKTYVDNADALKAPLASPTFTGSVTVPAPSAGGNPTTKTYVDAATAGLVPTSRTVNGQALSSNVTLTASDVSAVPLPNGGSQPMRIVGYGDTLPVSGSVGDIYFLEV